MNTYEKKVKDIFGSDTNKVFEDISNGRYDNLFYVASHFSPDEIKDWLNNLPNNERKKAKTLLLYYFGKSGTNNEFADKYRKDFDKLEGDDKDIAYALTHLENAASGFGSSYTTTADNTNFDNNLLGARWLVKNLGDDKESGLEYLRRNYPDYEWSLDKDGNYYYRKKFGGEEHKPLDPEFLGSPKGSLTERLMEYGSEAVRDIGDFGAELATGALIEKLGGYGGALLGGALGSVGGPAGAAAGAMAGYGLGSGVSTVATESLRKYIAEKLGITDKPVSEHLKDVGLTGSAVAVGAPITKKLLEYAGNFFKWLYRRGELDKLDTAIANKELLDKTTKEIKDTTKSAYTEYLNGKSTPTKEMIEEFGYKDVNPRTLATDITRKYKGGIEDKFFVNRRAKMIKFGKQSMEDYDSLVKEASKYTDNIDIDGLLEKAVEDVSKRHGLSAFEVKNAVERAKDTIKKKVIGYDLDDVKKRVYEIFKSKFSNKNLVGGSNIDAEAQAKIYTKHFFDTFNIDSIDKLKKIGEDKLEKYFDYLIQTHKKRGLRAGLESVRKTMKKELVNIKNINPKQVDLYTADKIRQSLGDVVINSNTPRKKMEQTILQTFKRNLKEERDKQLKKAFNNIYKYKPLEATKKFGTKNPYDAYLKVKQKLTNYRVFSSPEATNILKSYKGPQISGTIASKATKSEVGQAQLLEQVLSAMSHNVSRPFLFMSEKPSLMQGLLYEPNKQLGGYILNNLQQNKNDLEY